jgi:hypothetical protein
MFNKNLARRLKNLERRLTPSDEKSTGLLIVIVGPDGRVIDVPAIPFPVQAWTPPRRQPDALSDQT